jgi:hypothetical protein
MRFISLFVFLIIHVGSSAQSKCNTIRTGVYYSKANEKRNIPARIIDRAEFTQFETIGDAVPIQYNVHWNDACEFTLQQVQIEKEAPLTTIKIRKVRKKHYTYRSFINGKEVTKGKFFRTKI